MLLCDCETGKISESAAIHREPCRSGPLPFRLEGSSGGARCFPCGGKGCVEPTGQTGRDCLTGPRLLRNRSARISTPRLSSSRSVYPRADEEPQSVLLCGPSHCRAVPRCGPPAPAEISDLPRAETYADRL